MKTFLIAAGFVLLNALPLQAQDDDDPLDPLPSEPTCFDGKIRVAALISTGAKVRVGIVETANNASHLVSPGEIVGDIEVLDADYDLETVTLKMGGETCTLRLASDPNAARYATDPMPPRESTYRGEAIEKFLKENPNALKEGQIKFPQSVPHAVGRGEGIEGFLKAHPEIRIEALPPGSKGAGIEAELQKHPELRTNAPARNPFEIGP